MKDPDKLGAELALRLVPRYQDIKGLAPEDVRERLNYAVQITADTIAYHIRADRAQIRDETLAHCARVARTEFVNENWDRPVYSAKGSGEWIAVAIETSFDRYPRTNHPRRSPKEVSDDAHISADRTQRAGGTSTDHAPPGEVEAAGAE